MAKVSMGGNTAPDGEVAVRKMPAAEYEERVRSLTRGISLGDDVREWASARFEDGELRLTLHANGAGGTVSASCEVEPDKALQAAFRAVMRDHRERLHDALKVAIGRTLAAEVLSGGG
jgi:hypothetical protein